MNFSFSELIFSYVEDVTGYKALAAFHVNSVATFREEVDVAPKSLTRNFPAFRVVATIFCHST